MSEGVQAVSMKLILFLAVVGLMIAGIARIYRLLRENFWRRGMETSGFYDYFMQQHAALAVEKFVCDGGYRQLGGVIVRPPIASCGLIVMTHGYGRTLEHYLPEAAFFSKEGFTVLLFDGMGFGMSSGRWMKGLPQHVLDMQCILDYVRQDAQLSSLPLLLYGHSWGGYAADAAACLGPQPVRGIISVAAYNDALAVVRHVSERRYGRWGGLVILLFELYQLLFFGRIALVTAEEGLQKMSCPMLICHSTDDAVVSFDENFGAIRAALSGRENVEFLELNGRNHNIVTPPAVDVQQRAMLQVLAGGKDREKEQVLWQLQMMIDEHLMQQFADFYKSCLCTDKS